MKGERMAKRASFGNAVLKKLSDITNLQTVKLTTQEEKPMEISDSDKDKIDQLIKERMSLLKLIAERNKIIELSAAELQHLRVSIQKLQLQNLNLAQSNSQMLGEVNLGRERVKALQHELMCKDALLKAKNLGQEGKTKGNCHKKTCSQEGEKAASNEAANDEKPRHHSRRRAARSQSMGPSTTSQKLEDKEKVENKRRCLRRQSARFKSHEKEPTENLFEIEDAKFPVSHTLEEREESCVPNSEGGVTTERTSLGGRPLRRAVGKVQSYKEIPVNIKMRRKE